MSKVKKFLETLFPISVSGEGRWSNTKKKVKIQKIVIEGNNLKAYFSGWNTEKDGLIYTDPRFQAELKNKLKETIGKMDYSEQGMQGDDFVHFYLG